MKSLVGLMATLSFAMLALSQELQKPTAEREGSSPLMVSFAELKWNELPERKGMQFAILSGDPKTGPYTQMRRVPPGTDNPLHTHSNQIKNVIIQGVWYTGVNSAAARDFGPGSIIIMPADWVHVSGCRPGSECVFYQEGMGKFDFQSAQASAANPAPAPTTPIAAAPTVPDTNASANQAVAAAVLKAIAGHETESAESVFTNVKIPWLGNTQAQTFLEIMNIGYAQALGVRCNHCHVENDFASDAKRPKRAAREMAVMHHMINIELKKMQHILPVGDDRSINCTTCHRGAIEPLH